MSPRLMAGVDTKVDRLLAFLSRLAVSIGPCLSNDVGHLDPNPPL